MRPRRTPKPRLELLEGRALMAALVESEPNNRPETADVANLAAVDDTLTIDGAISNRRDRDTFRVTAGVSGALAIVVSDSGRLRAWVDVEDAAGNRIFRSRSDRDSRIGVFLASPGAGYTIHVRSLGNTTGRYVLGVIQDAFDLPNPGPGPGPGPAPGPGPRPGPVPEPSNLVNDAEPNDATSNATPFDLGNDGRVRLAGTLAASSDQDHFAFTARRAGRLTLSVPLDNDPVIVDVLDSGGRTRLTIFSDRPNLISSLSVTAGSRYFLRVRPLNASTGAYAVDLSLS